MSFWLRGGVLKPRPVSHHPTLSLLCILVFFFFFGFQYFCYNVRKIRGWQRTSIRFSRGQESNWRRSTATRSWFSSTWTRPTLPNSIGSTRTISPLSIRLLFDLPLTTSSLSLSIGNKREAKNFKLRATRGLQATWHSPLGRERETYIPWLLIGDITTFRLITVRPSWSLPLLCQQKKKCVFFSSLYYIALQRVYIYIYIPTVRNHDVRSCQVVMLYVIIYSILLLVELLLWLFFPPHFWYWLVYFSNLYLPSKSGLLHAYRFSDFINCYATIGWDKCTTTLFFIILSFLFHSI